MKRKVFVLFFAILMLILASCGYSESDLAAARQEGFNEGYDEGYDDAYYYYGYEKDSSSGSSLADESYHASSSFTEEYYRLRKLREGVAGKQEEIAPTSISRPVSGKVLAGREGSDSEITIKAATDSDYVISLKTVRGTESVAFYVRAGDTVTVGVPSNHLYVYFASGEEWYGYGQGLMFGENTVYSKDDELRDFTKYTMEYTLYPVSNGNFSETPSDESEFFQ